MKIIKNAAILSGAFAALLSYALVPTSFQGDAQGGVVANFFSSAAYADDGEGESDHDSDHDSSDHDSSDHDSSDHDSGDDHGDDGSDHDDGDDDSDGSSGQNTGTGTGPKTLMDLFTR